MTGTAELAVVPEGNCIRLTLQRPGKGNALSHSLVQALHGAVLDAVRARPRLVVVEGAGPHFCTGFDLSGLDDETDASLLARFELVERMLQALSAAPFPTLAIAQGRAMGAGADIFCACSHRWIAGDATFAFPGAGFGLVLGTARLADTVGAATAQGWVMGGAQITADAALAAQLAHRRVAPEALADELAATCQAMRRLDDETHAAIHEATRGARRPRGSEGDADDMARLVRSASRPGLKARIAAYRAAGGARAMKVSLALPAPVAAVFPGALVCVVVALAAMSLSEHYGGPQLLYALLLGLALHFLMGHAAVRPGIDFCGRVALRAGVALLGARITLGQIGSLGVASGVTVVVALSLTIGLGLCLARWLRRPMEEGLLSGGAVAICGASAALAIASVMPRTRENERFTLLVVVGVTVLSTLAMMVYPSVLYLVRVPPLPSGIFLGGTIHDVGQVVAAGMMLGPDVGDVATVVKLLRVALLMPVVFLVALFFGRGAASRSPRWALVPGFLVAFVVMVLLRSAGLVPAPVVDVASALSRGLLVVAIAATGIKTSFEDLLRLGWMPVVMLLAETFFIAAFMLAAILLVGLPR